MSLAHPAWLTALVLLPLLAAAATLAARSQGRRWATLAAARLRPRLVRTGNPLVGWLAFAFLLTAAALLITALARPQAESGTQKETTIGRNLLIALDLSRSMTVPDVQPDRLSQAKLLIYELLESMPGDRLGLIGFAGTAYLYAPLTVDHHAVKETVEQIDVDWPTIGGSNLADAVKLGIDTLRKTGQEQNALVIISDGEKHDGSLDQIIAEARESGVFILCIGVGTEDGDYIPSADFAGGRVVDANGTPVISRLQPEVLRQLAIETKGTYANAASGADIPGMIQSALARLDTFEMEGRDRRLMVEFYQWLVLPAVLFLLASFICGTRWKLARIATTALVIASLTPDQAHADLAGDARSALQQGRHQEALTLYQQLAGRSRIRGIRARYRLGEATAAYRAQDFNHARDAFSNALLGTDTGLRDTAHLGLANTLFQLGWSTISSTPYAAPGSPPPDMPQFDALVRQYLAAKRSGAEDPANDDGLKDTIVNWTDAVRHYDSVTSRSSERPQADHNRTVTIAYLQRLAELLEEDENQTQQMLPPPPPKESGEDNPGEPQDDQQPQPGGPEPDPDGAGNKPDPESDPKRPGDPSENPEAKDPSGTDEPQEDPQRPGETPEQRARRILQENADLEKGPLTPGYREFNNPEKDW